MKIPPVHSQLGTVAEEQLHKMAKATERIQEQSAIPGRPDDSTADHRGRASSEALHPEGFDGAG